VILQCWPVLKPQIAGEPLFPGAVTTNWSIEQPPIAPPSQQKKIKKSMAQQLAYCDQKKVS
jgi:hypothetical protein